ncbi:MAG: HD domain-containing protein [Sedimentibacter sp.]
MEKMRRTIYELWIADELNRMCLHSRFPQMLQYMQHGNVNVYQHCINVAHMSCQIAWRLHLKVNYSSLIRGALLHDYFLYDWHERGQEHRLHGFLHPLIALKNAREDFELTSTEANIILRHMFPLIPVPPNCLESWIVCVADKACTMREILRLTDAKIQNPAGGYRYELQ